MNESIRCLLASMLLLAAFSVAAQTGAAEDPPAEQDVEQTLGEAALTGEDEAGDAAEEVAPESGAEADGGEIKATMERFVPSEQISEDRSVSFPNDI